MQITILLFAGAREAAGRHQLNIELPANASYADVVQAVQREAPELSGLLRTSRLAANEEYVDPADKIDPAAEFALIPAVSGG